MDIILKLIMSFIATSAFGLIFNVPLRLLPICGTVGMGGWLVFIAGEEWLSLNAVAAAMLAAFCITSISQIFSRLLKTPIILFVVSGIIPLVPGRLAYNAMRNVVEDQYDIALQLGTQVLLISGAIAIGLVLSEVVHQFIRKAVQ